MGQREMELIHNILHEICDKVWQSDTEEYELWLKTEIGFTEQEIKELKENGCFPEPIYNKDDR